MNIFAAKNTDKKPKPDVKVDYPWHEIECRPNVQNLDVRKHYPRHIINGLRECEALTTVRNVMLFIVNSKYEPMPGVAVELRSENNVYCVITDENGVAYFPYVANTVYMVTLAKKGYNMKSFLNITFDQTTQMELQYILKEQDIRDGWYGNTSPLFYLDTLDGGHA